MNELYRWMSPEGLVVILSEIEILDLVEEWHTDHIGYGTSLAVHLGMTDEDYKKWVKNPSQFVFGYSHNV